VESTSERRRRIPKAADLLADRLRQRILAENLPAGTFLLSEPELVSQLGFSRATVRQALSLLEADGLVYAKRGPNGGIMVSRPDPLHLSRSLALQFTLSDATLEDLFVLRKMNEPRAAAIVAETASARSRDEILACATDECDLDGHVRFHGLIAEACDNVLLRTLLGALHEVVGWHSADEHLDARDLENTTRIHRTIATAIAEGRASVAERAMLQHLELFEEHLARQGRLKQPILPPARWADPEASAPRRESLGSNGQVPLEGPSGNNS
jgi:GntR family transcriptional repressor for pyruvate dehydrogenase complex